MTAAYRWSVPATLVAAALHALVGLALLSGTGLTTSVGLDLRRVWAGVWQASHSDFYGFSLEADGPATLTIGGQLIQTQTAPTPDNVRIVWIDAGVHEVVVEGAATSAGGIPVRWARYGSALAPFGTADLLRQAPAHPDFRDWLRRLRDASHLAWILGVITIIGQTLWRLAFRAGPLLDRPLWPGARLTRRRALAISAVTVVVAYGTLLRFDALTLKYGPVRQPRWLHSLQETRGARSLVRPSAVTWSHVTGRYTSDPYTYLLYAREMRSFYAAARREPIFPFVTRMFLWLLHDQDVAVSFASAAFSVLAIVATFLLGGYAFSYGVGLAAAAGLAIEYEAISWGVSGWRDDAFMCAVVLSAYAILRYARTASGRAAIAVGVVGGLACLVRITSVSFLLPGLIWLLLAARAPWRTRARGVALAAGTMGVIVAPFLFTCWQAYGDPLYAINVHADVYRITGGESVTESQTAAGYVEAKWRARPMDTLDLFARGMTGYPFLNKWGGFAPWASWIGPWLAGAALIGLVMIAVTSSGRLLLVVLTASLVPYSVTWKLAADWRFTEHAYPFFLIAAAAAVALAIRGIRSLARRDWPRSVGRVAVFTAIWCATLAAGTWFVTRMLPVLTAQESLLRGDDVSLMAGGRDWAFFTAGWSRPLTGGNVTVRVSDERAQLQIPLPRVQSYNLTLRLDPFPAPLAAADPGLLTVDVSLNGLRLATLSPRFNPDRVGAYDVHLPQDAVRSGMNSLTLFCHPGGRVSLWYVRVRPAPLADGRIGTTADQAPRLTPQIPRRKAATGAPAR